MIRRTVLFIKQQLLQVGLVVLLVFAAIVPQLAHAAQITSRSFTLSNSDGAATGVTYTFGSAALPTTGTAVKSVAAAACTTASGTCTTPTGFAGGSSVLSSQPTGLGAASGWTVGSNAGNLRITNSGNSTNPSGTVAIVWGTVTNPTADNATFFMRVTTYSDAAYTTAIDSGVVAVSTAEAIQVTASVDETLTFCVGTSGVTSSSCSGVTGNTVALGTLTSSTTGSGLSQIGVATNAQTGYSITINGATLTSGANTITALSTQTASSQGGEQYGVNLRANTTPSVGVDPDGSGTATPTANYNTANQYRFVTGDSIASKASADAFRRFQVSYIANIGVATEPGSYAATMTYIATPTF